MSRILLSIDDGCKSDTRVAELAEKYNIPCVFYWPVEWKSLAYDNGYEPLSYDDACMIALKHEIGSHTITHRHLTSLPQTEALTEILDSKYMLEDIFDVDITKFAPPRGYTNDYLSEFTLQIYESQRLTKGKGLCHIHPNSGANGNLHWIEYANTNDITEFWGHSWEWDKFNMWEEIEEYFANTYSA